MSVEPGKNQEVATALRGIAGVKQVNVCWYELISERVRRGSTIVTSNRPPTESYALFPNPVLAEGALDRLINASHHVTLQGKSYRPQRRPDRVREVTSENN